MPAIPNHLSAGNLNRAVLLQRKSTARNTLGEPVETWFDLAGGGVWAQLIEYAMAEDVRADETAARLVAQFAIRYTRFSPPLNPRDRLLWNEAGGAPEAGLIFNIRGVYHIGLNEGHLIDCWARSDQQEA